MKLQAPEKRKATGYWYIKRSNKDWLALRAAQLQVSQSEAMDILFDELRKKHPIRIVGKAAPEKRKLSPRATAKKRGVRARQASH